MAVLTFWLNISGAFGSTFMLGWPSPTLVGLNIWLLLPEPSKKKLWDAEDECMSPSKQTYAKS